MLSNFHRIKRKNKIKILKYYKILITNNHKLTNIIPLLSHQKPSISIK